jgi:hypothetical protein
MDFKGQATGRASLVSPTKPSLALLASISCDSTYVAGRPMGRLQVGSAWNEPEKRFDIRIRNLNEGVRNFDIDGYFRPKDKTLRAEAVLNSWTVGMPRLSSPGSSTSSAEPWTARSVWTAPWTSCRSAAKG